MRFPYSGNGTWTPDYHCGFIDAVKRFFIGYMEFRGRSSRREFWLAMLFFIPVSVLIFLIPAAGTVSGILWMLATMVPIMAISFRRLHDANRKTVGGKGSYDLVARNVRMLLSRYRSRPVGVRVTLTRGVTDVIGIHDHLKNDLGFHEVGFGPATSGPIAVFNLDDGALKAVFEDMKTLGRRYVEAACRGENIGFSNMHQLLTDIAQGTKKAVPCGAGLGMLAVDRQGDLHLCHRFVGSDQPTYGNVADGIDVPKLARFIEGAQDRSSYGCRTCRIRSICAGVSLSNRASGGLARRAAAISSSCSQRSVRFAAGRSRPVIR